MLMTPIIYTPDNENNYDNRVQQNVTKEYSQLDATFNKVKHRTYQLPDYIFFF